MDKALYIGMMGAKQTARAQTINSNNLANASTTGFRADFVGFLESAVKGPGYQSRSNVMAGQQGSNMNSGPLQSTGRTLDVAVRDKGWIAVQAPDGSEAYTRRGDLRVSVNGLLETADGVPVIGNGGPVAVPEFSSITIGEDGTISIVPKGQSAATTAVVDRIKLVDAEDNQLHKLNDGLFHTKENKALDPSVDVKLVSGALEGSNVNTVGSMVSMIELARQFETQVKVMKNAETNAQSAERLMRLE